MSRRGRRPPRLLDLYCGAGGCSEGYRRAGFEVEGVDIEPQPHYRFKFHQHDALAFLAAHGAKYDAIHASPPCKRFSSAARRNGHASKHPDLLSPTRDALVRLGVPWVIENVGDAPMRPVAVQLCGLMFGLGVFRHRWFESSSVLLFAPRHVPHGDRRVGDGRMVCVAGHGDYSPGNYGTKGPRAYQSKASWAAAMGIDWMTRLELSQAIPPAYTHFVGRQILQHLGR